LPVLDVRLPESLVSAKCTLSNQVKIKLSHLCRANTPHPSKIKCYKEKEKKESKRNRRKRKYRRKEMM
jgi:hypothetical protein